MSFPLGSGGGFLLTEVVVCIAVLTVLMTAMAASMGAFGRFNRYQFTRQKCTAAAQAQMDSIAATGRPIEPEECRRLWPGVDIVTSRAAGTGQWGGMTLVSVTAECAAVHKPVTVKLNRYLTEGGPR